MKAARCPEAKAAPGLALGAARRLTRQRREVYEILLEERDHPTATEIFLRAKERIPSISLATIYNCLETLAEAGLIRQVNLDRAPSRYCPNLKEHAHFHCTGCGSVADVEFRKGAPCDHLRLPRGASVLQVDFAIKGLCAACRSQSRRVRPTHSQS